jgi:hypothetical protein
MQTRAIAIVVSLMGLALVVLLAGSAMAHPVAEPVAEPPPEAAASAQGYQTGVVVDREGREFKVFLGRPPWLEATPAPPLKREQPEAAPRRPAVISLGLLRSEVSDYLQQRVPYRASLAPQGGILFAEVNSGSLPHRVGLRTGDRVVAIDGQRVASSEMALETYLALRPGTRLTLQVVRGQQRVELRLQIAA